MKVEYSEHPATEQGRLVIRLAIDDKIVASIIVDTGTLNIRRDRKRHLLRTMQGYGISKHLIAKYAKQGNLVKQVSLREFVSKDKSNLYVIPVEIILRSPVVQYEGYEPQHVIRVADILQYKKEI